MAPSDSESPARRGLGRTGKEVLISKLAGWVALSSLALSGCQASPAHCNIDSDCGTGAHCNKSGGAPLGVCQDNSVVAVCDGGCSNWQHCVMGACAATYQSLTLLSPQDGGVFDGSIPLQAKLNVAAGMGAQDPAFLSYMVSSDGGTSGSFPRRQHQPEVARL